jgi:hypothetical protein
MNLMMKHTQSKVDGSRTQSKVDGSRASSLRALSQTSSSGNRRQRFDSKAVSEEGHGREGRRGSVSTVGSVRSVRSEYLQGKRNSLYLDDESSPRSNHPHQDYKPRSSQDGSSSAQNQERHNGQHKQGVLSSRISVASSGSFHEDTGAEGQQLISPLRRARNNANETMSMLKANLETRKHTKAGVENTFRAKVRASSRALLGPMKVSCYY